MEKRTHGPNIEVPDDLMAGVLRAKSPRQRLAMAFAMWSFARRQLLRHLHAAHPDWEDGRIQKEAARRLSHGAV